ncbi:tyrosine-type recombinase/integrase [Flagellatimonas centrodinii]|uniref:tyrosine-type recombinase/integrase n=1 Tax=Flagellatimonas centrodinii TaxID=2806210 RepID=UPI001FF8016F|nr:tyrosine-type recombinase/integrase [Flagellatimonas centrodinii]ULQ45456.1 tyrosine-type recombinase/integrase [Flagellatimonas centrodinii]
MSPAPRRPSNRGLERGLHTHPTKGYRWRHPITGKYYYFGKACGREEANSTARALNLKFSAKSSIFDKIAQGETSSMRSLIEIHRREVLSSRKLADKTRATYSDYLTAIERKIGDWDVSAVTPFDVAQFLKVASDGDRARQMYRQQLVELFATAIEEGLRADNPAAATRRPVAKRKRARLTRPDLMLIRAAAPSWLQNAIDLALVTLQRREDICALTWDADLGTTLRIEQRKTGKRLEIEVSSDLRVVLGRCRDNIASPFIIHRLPEKARPRSLRAKHRSHHTQVLPEQLTRAFERAREASGRFSGIDHPPSFHEIRSLGIALYRDAGWTKEQVQRLAGHEHVEMTEHYLSGHEVPWERVSTGGLPPLPCVTEALP